LDRLRESFLPLRTAFAGGGEADFRASPFWVSATTTLSGSFRSDLERDLGMSIFFIVSEKNKKLDICHSL
jgi:hypothetical protein